LLYIQKERAEDGETMFVFLSLRVFRVFFLVLGTAFLHECSEERR
jgi:hypothetical protein